jgi:hypothetical protein
MKIAVKKPEGRKTMSISDMCRTLQLFQRVSMRLVCAGMLGLIMNLSYAPAYAEGCHPVQLSLVTPAQIVQKEDAVCGVRLDLLWGDNKAVWGLDAGLTNGASELRGIEVGGLVNRLRNLEDTPYTQSWGMQLAGLVNTNIKAPFAGFQVAGLVNDHDEASFIGIQVAGLANDNDRSSFGGLQVALFSNQNYQSEVTGIQLALFNQAQKLNGLQIGMANGVSAAEGAVGIVLLPICLADLLIHGNVRICEHPPLYNDAKTRKDSAVNGVQVGLITNLTESLKGFQISPFLNLAGRSMNGGQIAFLMNGAGDTQGFQAAIMNIIQRNVDGLQVGIFNVAGQDVAGAQIGIINICKNLKGLQIGAVNVVWGRFPSSVFFAPIINMGF